MIWHSMCHSRFEKSPKWPAVSYFWIYTSRWQMSQYINTCQENSRRTVLWSCRNMMYARTIPGKTMTMHVLGVAVDPSIFCDKNFRPASCSEYMHSNRLSCSYSDLCIPVLIWSTCYCTYVVLQYAKRTVLYQRTAGMHVSREQFSWHIAIWWCVYNDMYSTVQ